MTLRFIKTFCRNNNTGSALVTVICFSIIISISGLGLFIILSHMVKNEVESLRDTEAHLAAESGLLLGIRYIRELSVTEWPSPHLTTSVAINSIGLPINNHNVFIAYTTDGSSPAIITIESLAQFNGVDKKSVSYTIHQMNYNGHLWNIRIENWNERYH